MLQGRDSQFFATRSAASIYVGVSSNICMHETLHSGSNDVCLGVIRKNENIGRLHMRKTQWFRSISWQDLLVQGDRNQLTLNHFEATWSSTEKNEISIDPKTIFLTLSFEIPVSLH